MRKIGTFIRNIYRVFIVKPNGSRMVINCMEQSRPSDKGFSDQDLISDTLLRRTMIADELPFEVDPQLYKKLAEKVREHGHPSALARNSLVEIFLPLFSLKHMELKMAAISIALVIGLGIGPANNRAPNQNLNLFFLADSLNDTSVYHVPSVYDSALLYK